MKTPEDEAFEDIERRQGGGFQAKRAAAADKAQDESDMLTIAYLDGYERGKRAVLAQPAQEPVAKAWNDGYKAGVADERTSEANIGIAGFGAKIKPARQNPYGVAQPAQEPVCDKDPQGCWNVRCQLGKKCINTTPPKREWVGLTDEDFVLINQLCINPIDAAEFVNRLLKEKNT